MDFENAAMLSLLVYVGVELCKRLVPVKVQDALQSTLVVALAVGIGAVFLVAETVWAKEQVIGGHALDTLNGWDKLVVGLFAAAGAVGIDKLRSAVSSIGQNPE